MESARNALEIVKNAKRRVCDDNCFVNHLPAFRWPSFFSALVMMIAAGTQYAFGSFGPDLKVHMGYTQTELNLISSLLNAGMFLSVFMGPFYDLFGGRWTSILAAFLLFVGWFLSFLSTSHAITGSAVAMAIFMFVQGNGSGAAYTAALTNNVPKFSITHRGKVVGSLVAMFGGSGAVFAQLYRIFFQGDIVHFFLFMAIALLLMCIPGVLFFSPEPKVKRVEGDDKDDQEKVEEEGKETASGPPTEEIKTHGFDHPDPPVDVVIFSSHLDHDLSTPKRNNFDEDGDRDDDGNVMKRQSREGEFVTVDVDAENPFDDFHLSRGLDNINISEASRWAIIELRQFQINERSRRNDNNNNNNSKDSETKEIKIVTIDSLRSTLLRDRNDFSLVYSQRTNLLKMITTFSFWMVFISFMLVEGAGLAVINNLGSLVIAIEETSDTGSKKETLVSIVAISSCLGRLIFGFVSDWGAKSCSRSMLQFIASIFMGIVMFYISLFATDSNHLYPAVLALGISYGGAMTLIPSITNDLFGQRFFGSNWSLMRSAPGLCLSLSLFLDPSIHPSIE